MKHFFNCMYHLVLWAVLFFLLGNYTVLQAQIVKNTYTKTISGKIVDETSQPVAGATIVIKGSTRGVISDVDGSFKIDVGATEVLSISFVGYQTVEYAAGKIPATIKLVPAVDELDEVTIVGFAKQKKESVIGSVSTIKPEELKIPTGNLTQALGGRIAGLISYQTSGEPGADNAEFFVRGVTTFGYSKSPLILIDNIESGSDDLARLSPDDIAAFSIMKDATATSIYGARGANGVLLITTKRGKEGKVQINARVEASLSKPTRRIKMVDPISYMRYQNEAVITRNPATGIRPNSDEKIASTIAGKNPYVYPAVDWYDELFNDYVMNYRANLSMSGGGKTARYFVSLGINDDNGIMKMDKRNNYNTNIDLKKIHVRSNIDIDVTKTTQFAIKFNGNFDDYAGPIVSGNDLYRRAMATSPVLFPKYFAPDIMNENTNHILFGNADGNYINPYADMIRGYREYSKTVISAQMELNQKLDFITEGLNLRLFASTTRNSFSQLTRSTTPFYYSVSYYDKLSDKYTLKALNPEEGREDLNFSNDPPEISRSFYYEGAINYNRTFNDVHSVSGLLVGVLQDNRNYVKDMTVQTSLPGRNVGVSGRFTYDYDRRYFIEGNFGFNGSERFAKEERFGFFPSIGAAWMVSNEEFWNTNLNRIVNKLKLKATYGLVGNDKIGKSEDRFFYMSEVNLNGPGAEYGWGQDFEERPGTIEMIRYENKKIKWEIARKLNIGAEVSLFNIFDLQFDYFYEYRKNIFGQRSTIPAEMGFSQPLYANRGEASSRGFELQLDANHSFNKDFWLGVRGNFTYASGKYETLEEPYRPYPWLSFVGQRINQEYGLIAERLFIDEEDIINSPIQTFGEYLPGDIKYRDINNDGVIDNEDIVPIGISKTPEIMYGFGVSLGYKAFDISCFFQGASRVSFMINSKAINPFMSLDGIGGNNQNGMMQAYADDYWSETNRNSYATFPRLSTSDISNNNRNSTWWLRDGSYLRLKSVELGYTLPHRWTDRLRMSKLRVYASGLNLLTWNSFKMWDVEQGNDGMQYPIQAVYNVGINLNF